MRDLLRVSIAEFKNEYGHTAYVCGNTEKGGVSAIVVIKQTEQKKNTSKRAL